MIKLNIYKINSNAEADLVSKLERVGLSKTYDEEHNEYRFRFYFSDEPDTVDIWWVEKYSEFISPDEDIPQNRLYFGTLIISREESIYAVSLGKSHFYLNSFCDTDFGLNLAERILDSNELKVKHSKYYKSNKKKSITSFGDGNEMLYDAGESMHFIKGKTIDEEKWGKSVSFGHSVHLKVDVTPLEITSIIEEIEEALQQEPIIRIPKVEIVTDDTCIAQLDRKLSSAIIATEDPQLNIEQFTISGVNFIFTDDYTYKLYRTGNSRHKMLLSDFSVSEILSFINQNGINLPQDIDDLKVSVEREEGRNFTQKLKYYLDFIDDENRHCLIDGSWYQFNQSYVEYLRDEVNKIDFVYDQQFDIAPDVVERAFNIERAENDGYVDYDTDLTSIDGRYRVEKMDLYKDNSLYFVKKGTPQKLNYTIDQAITTLKILQQNEANIEIDGNDVEIQSIVIWFLLKRRTNINELSDINSLILHIKLAEWRKLTLEAGYTPRVFINYAR